VHLSIAQITAFSRALTIVAARDQHQIVQRLSWDSRTIQPDMLFVALPGEHLDGNDFIIEAFERGAAAVIASRQVSEAERFAAEQQRAALLYASDGYLALHRLAAGWRELLSAKVIGVTGSSGKTSTRTLISAVTEKAFLTVSSLGNRNNEIGVPTTVLSAPAQAEVLVVEMAMRGLGQIAELADIARPEIGVITNIGPGHLELLGTKDNVACAKAELIEALPDGSGLAILNGDDPYTPRIREKAQTFEREIRVVLFGLGRHNDIRATDITYDDEGHPSFDLWLPDGNPRRVALNLRGEHSVYNALAAATVGAGLGVEPSQIIAALERVQPAAMRQASHELADGTLLVDDSYNANPDSMRAALGVLRLLDHSRPHIAVLGDMGELGAEQLALHEHVGELVYRNEVDVLITIGELARHYAHGARAAGMDEARISSFSSVEEAVSALIPLREEAPIILVKASRFMGLERVVDYLIQGWQPPVVESESEDEDVAGEGSDASEGSDTGEGGSDDESEVGEGGAQGDGARDGIPRDSTSQKAEGVGA
jgi:UDP-N-acetylmuramoyl-tripeptide--D-alanyl-D-alanine ligase